MRITGSLIREFGYQPASWWKDAIGEAGGRDFADLAEAREYLDRFAPPPAMPLRASGALRWTANIEAEDEAERANIEAVSRHMDELMRVPTVVAGAVMPDACPSEAVLNWVRDEARKLPEPSTKAEVVVVTLDEMWHFVKIRLRNCGFGEPMTLLLGEPSPGFLVAAMTPHAKSSSTKSASKARRSSPMIGRAITASSLTTNFSPAKT